MNIESRYRTLIEETLNCSRLSGDGSFVTNVASQELRQCGDKVLPEIEKVICTRVAPDAETCADHHALIGRYQGLLNLWMAYFIVGEAEHMARMVQFLRSLDGPVLATAFLAMTPTWLYRDTNAAIPKPFLDFVRDVAETRTGSAAEIAHYLV